MLKAKSLTGKIKHCSFNALKAAEKHNPAHNNLI